MQNIECIYRFDSKWNSVGPEPLYVNLTLHIASFHYQYFRGFRHENAFVVSIVRALTITFLYTLFCFSFLPYPVSVVGKADDQNNISKI